MREIEAEELRRAEKAEAARLGGEFGLGDTVGVAWVRYSRSGYLGVILLASASVFTLIMSLALAGSSATAAVILGALTVAGFAGTWLAGRRIRARMVLRRFCWYSGGVAQTHPDRPAPMVLRWPDVDSVTLTFNDADERFNGLSWCTLAGDAGVSVSIDGAYPRTTVREVADLAQRILSPRIGAALIAAFDSGHPLITGGWRIDGTGVAEEPPAWRSLSLSWNDMAEIVVAGEDHHGVVDPPSLITITPKSGRRPLRLSLSGVRNGPFLPPLLEHAAQRQHVPFRHMTVPPGKGGS